MGRGPRGSPCRRSWPPSSRAFWLVGDGQVVGRVRRLVRGGRHDVVELIVPHAEVELELGEGVRRGARHGAADPEGLGDGQSMLPVSTFVVDEG